ncbi:MAG: hypothetical protein K0S74_1567 [Chlamydiales bacterium]|nr:hypothetical protein [Chlamydiales bacterium]
MFSFSVKTSDQPANVTSPHKPVQIIPSPVVSIAKRIFSNLNITNLYAALLVSKSWNHIAREELGKRLEEADAGPSSIYELQISDLIANHKNTLALRAICKACYLGKLPVDRSIELCNQVDRQISCANNRKEKILVQKLKVYFIEFILERTKTPLKTKFNYLSPQNPDFTCIESTLSLKAASQVINSNLSLNSCQDIFIEWLEYISSGPFQNMDNFQTLTKSRLKAEEINCINLLVKALVVSSKKENKIEHLYAIQLLEEIHRKAKVLRCSLEENIIVEAFLDRGYIKEAILAAHYLSPPLYAVQFGYANDARTPFRSALLDKVKSEGNFTDFMGVAIYYKELTKPEQIQFASLFCKAVTSSLYSSIYDWAVNLKIDITCILNALWILIEQLLEDNRNDYILDLLHLIWRLQKNKGEEKESRIDESVSSLNSYVKVCDDIIDKLKMYNYSLEDMFIAAINDFHREYLIAFFDKYLEQICLQKLNPFTMSEMVQKGIDRFIQMEKWEQAKKFLKLSSSLSTKDRSRCLENIETAEAIILSDTLAWINEKNEEEMNKYRANYQEFLDLESSSSESNWWEEEEEEEEEEANS